MNKSKPSILENKTTSMVLLVIITYAVYLKSLFFDFSPMDEDWLIIRNEPYLKDWNNLQFAFKEAIQGLYYRPLQMISYILDYHVGGSSPFIYHFTNVLLHALSVVMLYKLLIEFRTEKTKAFFLAAIFSIHPIALHAVAWIPGRHDLLLCLFTISSCYHLIKYIKQKSRKNAVWHFLFFLMALFTKENSIFLFPVFIFIFFIFKPVDKKQLALFVIIWLSELVLWRIMLTAIIKTTLSAGPDLLNTLKGFVNAMLMFIGKSVIPINQSVAPIADNISVIAGVIAIALVVFFWFKLGVANKKIALLGLEIYFILLAVPVWFGATLPLGEHLEHRVYTSMIGLMLFVGQVKFNTNSKLVSGIFVTVILLLGAKTFVRMHVYQDGLSYLAEASADCPKNYFYHSRRGNYLFNKGDFHGALSCFNAAVALYDKKYNVYNYRANTYVELGKKEEAIADLTKAYELSGHDPKMLYYRWAVYKRFGDTQNALMDSIALSGGSAVVIPPSADITKELLNSQLIEINKLIAAEPNNAVLYINRAKIYVDKRMGREALADLKKACELEPNNQDYKGYYNELNSTFPH